MRPLTPPVSSARSRALRLRLLALSRIVVAAVCLALPGSAGAAADSPQALDETNAQVVRSLVTTQLDALATDDAQLLFETTTPQVRQAFGSAGQFLVTLRSIYPMVVRPRALRFHTAQRVAPGVLQLVEVTDHQGQLWLALFSLERPADGGPWGISGCLVIGSPWTPA